MPDQQCPQCKGKGVIRDQRGQRACFMCTGTGRVWTVGNGGVADAQGFCSGPAQDEQTRAVEERAQQIRERDLVIKRIVIAVVIIVAVLGLKEIFFSSSPEAVLKRGIGQIEKAEKKRISKRIDTLLRAVKTGGASYQEYTELISLQQRLGVEPSEALNLKKEAARYRERNRPIINKETGRGDFYFVSNKDEEDYDYRWGEDLPCGSSEEFVALVRSGTTSCTDKDGVWTVYLAAIENALDVSLLAEMAADFDSTLVEKGKRDIAPLSKSAYEEIIMRVIRKQNKVPFQVLVGRKWINSVALTDVDRWSMALKGPADVLEVVVSENVEIILFRKEGDNVDGCLYGIYNEEVRELKGWKEIQKDCIEIEHPDYKIVLGDRANAGLVLRFFAPHLEPEESMGLEFAGIGWDEFE